jgi:hypothetical protein
VSSTTLGTFFSVCDMPWFWPRKKTSSAVDVLACSAPDFGEIVLGVLRDEIPATHAMIVVAYENLRLTMMVYGEPRPNAGEHLSLDQMIQMTTARLETETDPIVSRRLSWFFFAGLVARLNRLAVVHPDLQDTAAEVWLLLANSGRFLKSLLAHNEVWAPDEKDFFWMLRDERDGIEHVIRFVMPNQYLEHENLRALAEQNAILTIDGSGKVW